MSRKQEHDFVAVLCHFDVAYGPDDPLHEMFFDEAGVVAPELNPRTVTWLHHSSILARCFFGMKSKARGMNFSAELFQVPLAYKGKRGAYACHREIHFPT